MWRSSLHFLFFICVTICLEIAAASLESSCERLKIPVELPHDLPIVLDFLEGFETSRAPVAKFQLEIVLGRLNLTSFSSREGKSILDHSPVANAAALFTLKDGMPTLVLPRPGELGVVAVNLFHEMVHVLDSDFISKLATSQWQLGNLDTEKNQLLADPAAFRDWLRKYHSALTSAKRMVFRAERLAYDKQRALLEDIFSDLECAEAYYLEHEGGKRLIVSPLSDKALRKTYQLGVEDRE